jgi:Flp pilus assembly CpaF family ATPase
VLDEVFGFGPLEPLLRDKTVSDILVNTYKQVFRRSAAASSKPSLPRFRTISIFSGSSIASSAA